MYGKSQWDIILESLTEPFVFISDWGCGQFSKR